MRLRWLALYPVVYAALFLAVAGSLEGPAQDGFVAWQRIALRVLAIAGCYAATSVYEPGDRLRRAWLWLGIGTVIILARDVLRLLPRFWPNPDSEAETILTALGILSNLALLAGIWMLARAWKLVTLERPGGRAGMAAIIVATAVAALLIAGPGALQSLREVTGGHRDYLVILVSALVDIVSLCLITPLLLTAVALRGGLFFWPWALITASRFAWVFYDAAALAPETGLPLADLFRGLAQNYVGVAGLAQLLVVLHVRNRTRAEDMGGGGGAVKR
jgi:hypothetical protein